MPERFFLYHAHGYALGGRFEQPVVHELDSHAATTLSVVGGYATASRENFRIDKLISYDTAHTTISGIKNDDTTHSSVVNTVITGLNILDVVTADKITGRLSSKHVDGQPAEIIPLGSSFENLRIAGVPVEVEMCSDLFARHPTHEALRNHFLGKCKKGDKCDGYAAPTTKRFEWGGPEGQPSAALKKKLIVPTDTGFRESGGKVYSSIVCKVKEITSDPTKQVAEYGYAIEIPQVGRLYLGELSSDGNSKQLTMLRLELGSPVVGSLAAAGPQSNGQWIP